MSSPTSEKWRIVVVDDSPVVRTLLKHIIDGSNEFQVVGEAGDGESAIEVIRQLRPHAVTMDAQMPKLDGPEAIRRLMQVCPTPVILCSVLAIEGAPVVLEALQAGAVDFVTKPRNVLDGTSSLGRQITDKLRAAVAANKESLAGTRAGPQTAAGLATGEEASSAGQAEPEDEESGLILERVEVVVIGASTGGPKTVLSLLPGFPKSLAPAVIVALQDTPAPILRLLAEQLRKECPMPLGVPAETCPLEPGRIYLLPSDHHAQLVRGAEKGIQLRILNRVEGIEQSPSLNGLFSSTAITCPGATIGVLLTGTGKDGAIGLKKIRNSGGRTIAEHKRTAVLYEKPQAAIDMEVVDLVLPSYRIVEAILTITKTAVPAD